VGKAGCTRTSSRRALTVSRAVGGGKELHQGMGALEQGYLGRGEKYKRSYQTGKRTNILHKLCWVLEGEHSHLVGGAEVEISF